MMGARAGFYRDDARRQARQEFENSSSWEGFPEHCRPVRFRAVQLERILGNLDADEASVEPAGVWVLGR